MTVKQKTEYLKYKKCNKANRAKMLVKMGHASEEAYFKTIGVTSKTPASKTVKKTSKAKPGECLDMVVAFDTTGSMASYIQAVREHVRELVTKLFKNTPGLKMKIVAFGDYCDMRGKDDFGKAYQETDLTDDVNKLIKFINEAENTAGGDGDEFYELVIKKVVEETKWRDGKKAMMLVADADPHEIGYSYSQRIINNQIDWREEAKKAKSLGIQIDTLRIHPNISWYKELSKITDGVCLDFKTAENLGTVMEGTTYARAASYSATSATAYAATMDSVTASGNTELIGAFKTINTLTDLDSE